MMLIPLKVFTCSLKKGNSIIISLSNIIKDFKIITQAILFFRRDMCLNSFLAKASKGDILHIFSPQLIF